MSIESGSSLNPLELRFQDLFREPLKVALADELRIMNIEGIHDEAAAFRSLLKRGSGEGILNAMDHLDLIELWAENRPELAKPLPVDRISETA